MPHRKRWIIRHLVRELVPSIIAIKWKTPVSSDTLKSTLTDHSLAFSTEASEIRLLRRICG
jgi:hypothetical protein